MHRKNSFAVKYLKIYLAIDLKIILLNNHQNNYAECFSVDDNAANSFKF